MPARKSSTRTPERLGVQHAREQLYRTLVMDAAEELFGEKGVEATKMEEIAQTAGLSLSTVYAVMRGKSAILDALHETRLTELVESAGVATREVDSPLEMLIAGVRIFAEYFMTHLAYLQIYIDEGRSWGLPVRGRNSRARVWERGHSMQVQLFQRGIEDGTFYSDEPERMANTLVAMQQVRLADWLAEGRREDSEEVIAGMERQLRRSFCRRAEDRRDT